VPTCPSEPAVLSNHRWPIVRIDQRAQLGSVAEQTTRLHRAGAACVAPRAARRPPASRRRCRSAGVRFRSERVAALIMAIEHFRNRPANQITPAGAEALTLRNGLASRVAVRPQYRNDTGAGVSAENLSDLVFAMSGAELLACKLRLATPP
jgi:hypothetical protein